MSFEDAVHARFGEVNDDNLVDGVHSASSFIEDFAKMAFRINDEDEQREANLILMGMSIAFGIITRNDMVRKLMNGSTEIEFEVHGPKIATIGFQAAMQDLEIFRTLSVLDETMKTIPEELHSVIVERLWQSVNTTDSDAMLNEIRKILAEFAIQRFQE